MNNLYIRFLIYIFFIAIFIACSSNTKDIEIEEAELKEAEPFTSFEEKLKNMSEALLKELKPKTSHSELLKMLEELDGQSAEVQSLILSVKEKLNQKKKLYKDQIEIYNTNADDLSRKKSDKYSKLLELSEKLENQLNKIEKTCISYHQVEPHLTYITTLITYEDDEKSILKINQKASSYFKFQLTDIYAQMKEIDQIEAQSSL